MQLEQREYCCHDRKRLCRLVARYSQKLSKAAAAEGARRIDISPGKKARKEEAKRRVLEMCVEYYAYSIMLLLNSHCSVSEVSYVYMLFGYVCRLRARKLQKQRELKLLGIGGVMQSSSFHSCE